MYAFDEMHTDLLYFWKKGKIWNFLRDMPHGRWCRSIMEMQAYKTHKRWSPLLLALLIFFLLLVVSIASLAETHSKRKMIWLYGVRPIRKSGPCSPDHYGKKKKIHASYAARARAARRAIYIQVYLSIQVSSCSCHPDRNVGTCSPISLTLLCIPAKMPL